MLDNCVSAVTPAKSPRLASEERDDTVSLSFADIGCPRLGTKRRDRFRQCCLRNDERIAGVTLEKPVYPVLSRLGYISLDERQRIEKIRSH